MLYPDYQNTIVDFLVNSKGKFLTLRIKEEYFLTFCIDLYFAL